MGGQDKGLVELAGRPMVTFVLAALAPQVGNIVVNANRNLARYAEFGHAVVSDEDTGYLGPLAGMLCGARAARTEFVVTAPCDSPLIPSDFTDRLYRARVDANADICVAHDGERAQPVFCLMRRTLAESISAFLETGERKIDRWFAKHQTTYASFADKAELLLNVNRISELGELEAKLLEKG